MLKVKFKFFMIDLLNVKLYYEYFSVEAINTVEDTVLHIAARHGYYQICDMLLDAGASCTVVNR